MNRNNLLHIAIIVALLTFGASTVSAQPPVVKPVEEKPEVKLTPKHKSKTTPKQKTTKENNIQTKTQPHGGMATGVWKNGVLYNGSYDSYRVDNEREITAKVVDGKYQGQGTEYYYAGTYKGYKYVGDYKNGGKNGQGTSTLASGDKYVGQFVNGHWEGQGTYTWASGTKYVGQWKNGKRDGYGTQYHANGKICQQGQWKEGKFVGNSNTQTKTQPHGGKATGEWRNGVLYNGNYDRYRVDSEREITVKVVDGKYQGQGTEYHYAGSYKGYKFVGDFKDGNKNGQGTSTFASGDKYVGQFVNGHWEGQGTYTWTSGCKYVGQWKNDKIDGQGTYTWASGTKYVGQWKNGKRDGYGTQYHANGKICQQGQWKEGKFVGNSNTQTKTQPHGGKATGEWKNGVLYNGSYDRYRVDSEREITAKVVDGKYEGYGTEYYYAGTYKGYKYVGDYKNGGKNGQGTYTWTSGGKYVGQWKNDKIDGQGTYTYASGYKFVGQWINGKREGYGTLYLANGQISQQGQWKDDKFIGK